MFYVRPPSLVSQNQSFNVNIMQQYDRCLAFRWLQIIVSAAHICNFFSIQCSVHYFSLTLSFGKIQLTRHEIGHQQLKLLSQINVLEPFLFFSFFYDITHRHRENGAHLVVYFPLYLTFVFVLDESKWEIQQWNIHFCNGLEVCLWAYLPLSFRPFCLEPFLCLLSQHFWTRLTSITNESIRRPKLQCLQNPDIH